MSLALTGLPCRTELTATAQTIATCQSVDGAIAWERVGDTAGKVDAWDHVECAMALLVAGVAVILASSACSRLTFVKPSVERRGLERTAPKVRMTPDSYDSPAAKSRLLVQQGQVALSQGNLPEAGDYAAKALKVAPDDASAIDKMLPLPQCLRRLLLYRICYFPISILLIDGKINL